MGGFGGVAIGAAPVAVAGAVVGSAVYGAKTAIEEGDATALGALVGGAAMGAGVSTVVGGMGLAVGGTAIAVGMAPVVAVGAVAGLASYGLKKLLEAPKKDDSQSVGQAISDCLEANLAEQKRSQTLKEQAARDEFWARRDAESRK